MDGAVVHHRDPVAQLEELIEVFGDEERRGVPLPERPERGVDRLRRADIDPPGGVNGDHDRRVHRQFPGDEQLLLVAAGEIAQPGRAGGGLTSWEAIRRSANWATDRPRQ